MVMYDLKWFIFKSFFQNNIKLKIALKSSKIGFDAIKEEAAPIDQSKVAQKSVVSSLLDKSNGSLKASRPKGQDKLLHAKSILEKGDYCKEHLISSCTVIFLG